MIKRLLFFILGTTALAASAQLNSAGTGLVLDYSDAASNCNLNGTMPGNDGVMQYGNSIKQTSYLQVGGYLVLESVSSVPGGAEATWFPVAVVDGENCSSLWLTSGRIDMTNDTEITMTAKSSSIGATLEFFVGAGGSQWSVGSSTYHEGAGVIFSHTFTTADTDETFAIDLAAISGSEATWNEWVGKNDIHAIGYRSATDGAVFSVKRLEIGAESTGTTSGGGDETCSDGIMNQDETGIDCGGTSCSPCGGGTGNGTTCIVTTDDGQAEATYYTNLEDQGHALYTGNVTCSYTRDDIVGSNYGALETATLHETPAKYCGMCVEMTGANGTATVQVVDECPDCYAHNDGDTDIDLSPSAFADVVGSQDVGRSAITWSEISCPWTTPLHVIFQGSNYSYAKVIIGNHVNRISKVEIGSGGTYHEMVRGNDNGWTKSDFGGAWDNFIMDVRVTDIYGEEVVVTELSLENNPTDTQTDGTSNFPVCGLSTSNGFVNSLNYVSVFPNPATSSIVFDGIEDVKTMEIINLSGRVVATKYFGQAYSNISLDISNLAAGIYVAKMTGENATGTATFVKK
jgi:expansin (peptidoglycan-binding protein)